MTTDMLHNICAQVSLNGARSLQQPRKRPPPGPRCVLRSARSVSDGRAQRTQAPATVGLFITSPGFAEDGGSNSSPKRPSLEQPASYSLMNKSANALQSDGKGTSVKASYERTRLSRGCTRMFSKGTSRWVVPAIITGVRSSLSMNSATSPTHTRTRRGVTRSRTMHIK
jgi:hypothetical protein